MFAIAEHCGELNYATVTSVGTPGTVFTCAQLFQNLYQTTDDAFNFGQMRLRGGSTYVRIDDYVGSTRTFTLNGSGLSGITAGNEVHFTSGNPRVQANLFNAVNAAIRESWGDYNRETITNRADAFLTLASGTNEYTLTSTIGKLIRIGIQPTTRDGIMWFDPLNIWRVEGEEGDYKLHFLPGYSGTYSAAWSSRVRQPGLGSYGTFADAFAGEPLCLHFIEREPEMTGAGSETRLPMTYMEWVGSEKYLLNRLAIASDEEKRTLNILLPQVQQKAAQARAQLRLTKRRPPTTVELDF